MNSNLVYILIAILAAIIGSAVFIHHKIKELNARMDSSGMNGLLQMMNQNMLGIQSRFDSTSSAINERLDAAARVIGQVNKELGAIQSVGTSIKSFQEFLNSPKTRGNLGEQVLYDSLKQHFPPEMFETQKKFRDGNIVDAAVKTGDGLICIDSKFPMEAFRRMRESQSDEERLIHLRDFSKSVKKHIDDIAKKYILTGEGTLDFAVMYVPSENIFYELVTESHELMDHAHERKVLLVSPNSLVHFLRIILMGIERTKLQASAKKIWELLSGIQQESRKFGETLSVVTRHVTNAKNAIDLLNTEFNRLSSQIDQSKYLDARDPSSLGPVPRDPSS